MLPAAVLLAAQIGNSCDSDCSPTYEVLIFMQLYSVLPFLL